MTESSRKQRCAAAAIDAWRVFYVLLPVLLAGSVGAAVYAFVGVSSAVERGRPYDVRKWKSDAAIENIIADEGKEALSAVGTTIGDLLGEARSAAWDSAAGQKLRERFVDEAKKEPALEKLVDQVAKAYEAIVLISERSEAKAEVVLVKRAVGERVRGIGAKIDAAKARVARFAGMVALYRASQVADYVGLASVAEKMRGEAQAAASGTKEKPPVVGGGPSAAGRGPLEWIAAIDRAIAGKSDVKGALSAACRLALVMVAALAALALLLWVARDLCPAWLLPGRREVGLVVVDAATGDAADRRARVVRGIVATVLLPVHAVMVLAGASGVADRVAGTRVVKR